MNSFGKGVVKMNNRIDFEFERLVSYVNNNTSEEMLTLMLDAFTPKLCNSIGKKTIDDIIEEFHTFAFFWGDFDPAKNNYERFIKCIESVKENIEELKWLYYRLNDYRSKNVLLGILRCWIYLDYDYRKRIKETNFDEYYDFDILGDMNNEMVFVDCGSYDGDSAYSFINNQKSYKHIYLYDMILSNIEKSKEKLANYSGIIYRNAGVTTKEKSDVCVAVNTEYNQAVMLHPESVSGEYEKMSYVPLVNLDDDIQERIDMIKMDIEAAELDALVGAKNHIINEKPKLAVCTYHLFDHIWQIPKLICSYRDDYKLYMRYYGKLSYARTSEFTLFAV